MFLPELSSRMPTIPVTLEPESAVDGAIPDASSAPPVHVAPKKPYVGSFGSFSALLSDGMSLSLSIYGDVGEPADGRNLFRNILSNFRHFVANCECVRTCVRACVHACV